MKVTLKLYATLSDHLPDGARSWRIGVEPLPLLRLGLVRLERHQIDFDFDGYSPKEIDEFMARFEMYFRRGGG